MTTRTHPVTCRPMTPVDTELLISKIKEERYSYKMIEDALHISSTAFYNKLHGRVDFTGGEIATLKKLLNLNMTETNRIFFAPDVASKAHFKYKKPT